MMAAQEAGSTAKKGKVKEAKDFDECYNGARHISTDGWDGVPAAAFRNAMIGAAGRLGGQKMTHVKLSLFVRADGSDKVDGTPLVRIDGDPERFDMPVRLPNGSFDIRSRPRYTKWKMNVTVSYDTSMFTAQEVVDLMDRVGAQCGIGEGRHSSKNSAGLGWGCFHVAEVTYEE
jgi:hypothetical protein